MHLFTIVKVLFIILYSATLIMTQNEVFKINKLNLIWTKAEKSLGPDKLKDLKNDLDKHELDELSLKKMKTHNQDKDGLFEAAVRKRLLTILAKYSLDRYFDDVHPVAYNEKNLSKSNSNNKNSREGQVTFRDSKLDKLWKKAEKSGFSQEQLMILHEEFEHQQDKLDEHYETMNMIEEELDKRVKDNQKFENSLENFTEKTPKKKLSIEKAKEKSSEKKARLDTNIHQTLKDKYGDIKKGYVKLQKKVVNREIHEDTPFEEEPVIKLWSAAQKSSFTEEELESFKEELEHYETRIKKLKHFENQLERNQIVSKDLSSGAEEDDEAKHIRKRVKELSRKVEKTHKSLEKRVINSRDEL